MDAYVEINLGNIIKNYRLIYKKANKPIIAIIKDNAYGHGLIKVGQELAKNNVYMLAVSSLNEAITIRKNMIFSPLLLLGRCDDAKTLFAFKITPGISSISSLKNIAKDNISIPIHLEIETGMNRLGLSINEIEDALEIIKHSNLKLKGIYTHLCSDNYKNQLSIFEKAIEKFGDYKNLTIHIQSSKYIDLDIPYVTALRVGLALYGYSNKINLSPCLKYYIPIWKCKPIKENESIGYDQEGITTKDGYISTMPIGYSTSFSRLKKIEFYKDDTLLSQIGKPCMDMMMFYSENEIKEGTYINIISDKNIKHLLKINKESIYYVLSSISPSIIRKYI